MSQVSWWISYLVETIVERYEKARPCQKEELTFNPPTQFLDPKKFSKVFITPKDATQGVKAGRGSFLKLSKERRGSRDTSF